ncbi:TPA: hypothetical protein NUW79_003191 [Escherichia coli]|nr:hypothetical protein [Escherichia coli]
MKLKLTAVGYENFTGLFGTVEYVDGLSVSDVMPQTAKRVACVISVEWEDGTKVGVADALIANQNMPAPDETATVIPPEPSTVPVTTKAWAEEELGAVADEKGIAGLREIAEPYGIKGNSIAGLIKAIMEKSVAKEA